MQKIFFISAIIAVLFSILMIRPPEAAAKPLALIRDAEIEGIIRDYATPLFKAAGLEPSYVNVYLVKDSQLNAFVAGGQKIFINTGLLIRSKHPGQTIGVIAHEIGHIAGGHLSRTQEAIRNSTAQTLLAFVLGGLVAIGTGRSDVGTAVMIGAQGVGIQSFLQYTRTQESAADYAAFSYLEKTGQSARGLDEFLVLLGEQEAIMSSNQNPYLRTHPLNRDRIAAVRHHIANSPYSDTPQPTKRVARHDRMRAKLVAFIEPAKTAMAQYREPDNSVAARYARAIIYFRQGNLDRALPLIDGLIADDADDPFFHELKGQMLFENGRISEAVAPYETAVTLLPQSALLRADLGRVQLEINDAPSLDAAIDNLRIATLGEPRNPSFWHHLAIAYGRRGDMARGSARGSDSGRSDRGMSALSLAESALLKRQKKNALYQSGRAQSLLARGSIGWLKAQDIKAEARRLKDKTE